MAESVEKADSSYTLATTIARMAKIGACSSPSFSPDGSRLAFVSDMTGVPQVWTVNARGGWPTLVTALDDPVADVAWSPDDAWLAFSSAPGGGMNSQIFRMRPDGTQLERLTEGGTTNNWLGHWTHDGHGLSISSSKRTPEAMDVYLIDMESGQTRLIANNPGIGRVADISRDGKRAIVARVKSRSNEDFYLIDSATQAEKHLTPHEGPGNYPAGRFTPDGQTILLGANTDRDRVALARITLDNDGNASPLTYIAARDDAELQNFALTEDGSTAALVWNVAGRNELAFLDLASGQQTPAPALPGEIVTSIDFSRDGRLLALAIMGANRPSDVWVIDRTTGGLWQVTQTPHAGIDLSTLVRPELVRFPAHDGLELSGWLYRPTNHASPGPVVLSFHGGPEAQERPIFNSTYQALLAQGIAVFAPNVRGSSGFGKTFVNLDNGPLRVNAVRDIKACVDYVIAAGVTQKGQIGIMGGSYGGYMTMAGLVEYPDLFAAGANLFGVVNFETFFKHTEPWMAAVSTVKYGDPVTQADMLRDLSPINKIDRVVAPTLVLHGANDTNVPVVEAEQVVENLKQRNVPVSYVLFPDEGHGFRKTANRVRATTEIVRWFNTYLAK